MTTDLWPRVVVAAEEHGRLVADGVVPLDELRVLLVEDTDADAELVAAYLDAAGVSPGAVVRAARLDAAVDAIRRVPVDCTLLDLGLPDVGGLDALAAITSAGPDVAVVVLTGDDDIDHAAAAVAAGAQDYLVKGTFGPDALMRSIRHAVQRQAARRERRELLRALQREHDRLVEVQRVARIGGWWYEPTTADIGLTPEASELFGVSAAGLQDRDSFRQYIHVDDRDTARTLLARAVAGEPVEGIVRVAPHDGVDRWVHVRSAAVFDDMGRPWGTVQDVTEQVQLDRSRAALQARLERGQRLATLGRLAGGVAHDINNLIAVMAMGTSVARELLADDHPANEQLALVADAIDRASSLTAQMLVLGRRDEPAPSLLSVGAVVEDLEPLLRRTVGDGVELRLRLEDAAPVRVDRSQIEQLVLNLSSNARDATGVGGTVTIEVAPAGDGFVRLRVADDGSGMDPATVERAFEPFFTTKPIGQGTGLGLALVQGIAEAAGGEVALSSAPGEGTTVDVLLPAVATDARPATPATAAPVRDPDGGATILVVDDYEPIATLVSRLLTLRRHRVLTATNPADAAALAASVDDLDLLVTDVVMGAVSGRDLAAQLRVERPDLPVVFISGYTADVFAGEALGPRQSFLRKPFNDTELFEVVDHALRHARR